MTRDQLISISERAKARWLQADADLRDLIKSRQLDDLDRVFDLIDGVANSCLMLGAVMSDLAERRYDS